MTKFFSNHSLALALSALFLGHFGCQKANAPLNETDFFSIDREIEKPNHKQNVHLAIGQPQSYTIGSPPPDPIIEEVSYDPPYPGWVWIDGYWHWNDLEWEWIAGDWMPPRGSLAYVEPTYYTENNFITYTAGYWEQSYAFYNNPGFIQVHPNIDHPLSKKRPRPKRFRPRRPVKPRHPANRPRRHISKVIPRALNTPTRPGRTAPRPPTKPRPIESRVPGFQGNTHQNPTTVSKTPTRRPNFSTRRIETVQATNKPNRPYKITNQTAMSPKPTRLPGVRLPGRLRGGPAGSTIIQRRPFQGGYRKTPQPLNRQTRIGRTPQSIKTAQPYVQRPRTRVSIHPQNQKSNRVYSYRRPQKSHAPNRHSFSSSNNHQRPRANSNQRNTKLSVRQQRQVKPRVSVPKTKTPQVSRRAPRARTARSNRYER